MQWRGSGKWGQGPPVRHLCSKPYKSQHSIISDTSNRRLIVRRNHPLYITNLNSTISIVKIIIVITVLSDTSHAQDTGYKFNSKSPSNNYRIKIQSQSHRKNNSFWNAGQGPKRNSVQDIRERA